MLSQPKFAIYVNNLTFQYSVTINFFLLLKMHVHGLYSHIIGSVMNALVQIMTFKWYWLNNEQSWWLSDDTVSSLYVDYFLYAAQCDNVYACI